MELISVQVLMACFEFPEEICRGTIFDGNGVDETTVGTKHDKCVFMATHRCDGVTAWQVSSNHVVELFVRCGVDNGNSNVSSSAVLGTWCSGFWFKGFRFSVTSWGLRRLNILTYDTQMAFGCMHRLMKVLVDTGSSMVLRKMARRKVCETFKCAYSTTKVTCTIRAGFSKQDWRIDSNDTFKP